MSLTSFLKDDQELRAILDNTFEKPDMNLSAELKAEPRTTNYPLIGTAYDYLLRFYLENAYNDITSKPWVAETGLTLIPATGGDTELAHTVFEEAETAHESFLESGEIDNALLKGTLDLARIDWVYRSGRPPNGLSEYEDGDLDDLRQLYHTIPEGLFTGAQNVLLNPTFGEASQMVSGADADLVLDESLIDIKTTKYPKLKIDYWRQLVGYCVLADVADEETTGVPKFSEVGIYFSRHGELWTTSTEPIYGHEKYEDFKQWFCNQAREHFDQ